MTHSSPVIRGSCDADIPEIAETYGHFVRTALSTFEIDPPDAAEMAHRRQAVLNRKLPYLVARGLCVAVGLLAFSPGVGPARGAQEADSAPLAFEVASVKPSTELGNARLLASIENDNPRALFSAWNQTFQARGTSAAQLVAGAYLIPVREIVAPSWMSDARFDIYARIPAGQSPERASEMLRTLLEGRFALKAHREVRRMSGYILSIGPGGPKLTETGPPVPTNKLSEHVSRIKPGFNGRQMDHCGMLDLTRDLAQMLGAPVEDRTGLKGHYAILIQYLYSEWADESARPEILRDALRDYGLHLASGKVDAPVLVIDNMSKTPTEN